MLWDRSIAIVLCLSNRKFGLSADDTRIAVFTASSLKANNYQVTLQLIEWFYSEISYLFLVRW